MSEGRNLLPEWRYWPGVVLAMLIVVAALGLVYQPSDQTKNQASNPAQTYVDPRTPDQRIADYTLWLERFTGLLVLVSGFQIWFLTRADRTGRIAAEAARKSADAVLEMERPRLHLTKIALLNPEKCDATNLIRSPWVEISFRNYGRSPAFLLGTHFDLHIGNELPVPISYPEGMDKSDIVKAGKSLSWMWNKAGFRPASEKIDAVAAKRTRLWMYGVVVYKGFADQEYQTGFCGYWSFLTLSGELQLGFAIPSRSPYIYQT